MDIYKANMRSVSHSFDGSLNCACGRHSELKDSLRIERERRKDCETHCKTLLSELDAREIQLEEIKNTLLRRVSDAEFQMKKLVHMRDEETKKAEKATGKLRSSITQLQQRHEREKQELNSVLRSVRDANSEEAYDLRGMLKQSETEREKLSTKLRQCENANADLTDELNHMKQELGQSTNRLSQLTQSHSELSTTLIKLKSAYQKTCTRAETAGKQVGDLRKQVEQTSLAITQSEQSARTANERRAAAESALSTVRQRADTQSQRVAQMERELATEKARAEEKGNSNEAEMQKLRRRILAIQSEAAKWKRAGQMERDARLDQTEQTKQAMQTMLSERDRLNAELEDTRRKESETIQMIEELQRRSAQEATNASSRLLVALSTGEEGVSTALELKRCIEEKLQPELEEWKQSCQTAKSESEEWRLKHESLHADLEKCRTAACQLEARLAEKQATVEHEMNQQRQQLAKAEEEVRLKAALLAKSEEQVQQHENDLAELRKTQQTFSNSTEGRIADLNTQLIELRSTHEATMEKLRSSQRLAARMKSARDTTLSGLARAQVELKENADSHETAYRQRTEELNTIKLKLRGAEQKICNAEIEISEVREESVKQLVKNREEYERTIGQMKQQLNTEAHKAAQLQDWVNELRKQLSDTDAERQSATEERMFVDNRYDQSERRRQELEAIVSDYEQQLDKLKNEVIERSRLLDARAIELQDLQSTMLQRIEEARKDADNGRSHAAEREFEKQLLERKLQEAERIITEGDQERKQLNERVSCMNRDLVHCREAQLEQVNQHNRSQSEVREDLAVQLREAQQQRDRATECLREANQFLVEQTTSRQSLMERMQEMQTQYEQTHTQIQGELDSALRERGLLKQQVEQSQQQLLQAESLVREAEQRVTRAEMEQNRAVRDAHQLALEAASRQAVAQATEASLRPLQQSGGTIKGGSGESSARTLTMTPPPHPPPPPSCCYQSFQIGQPDGCCPTISPGDQLKVNSMADYADRRKVTFAPLPVDPNGSQLKSSAASDLEALIREVTCSLDREYHWR